MSIPCRGQATYLPESATTALAAMGVGDVSAVLEDADAPAYLILKITDHYTLAEDGTVDVATVPAALRTKLAADLADANASDAQSTFSQSLVESTLVTINAMPAGLPYDLA